MGFKVPQHDKNLKAFAVQYTGYFKVPKTGRYVFSAGSDSGDEIWVHNNLVIDDGYTHSVAVRKNVVFLVAGWHPIHIAYRHDPAEENAKFNLTVLDPDWHPLKLNGANIGDGRAYENAPVQVAK